MTRHSLRRWGVLLLALLCASSAAFAIDNFAAGALRGLTRFNVAVLGVEPGHARYGLKADELRRSVEDRLRAAGLGVADDDEALRDPQVGQIAVKLVAVEGSYSLISYAVSVQARRKLPLGADNGGFLSQAVWSKAQNGMLNPSDLRRIQDYTAVLVDAFIAAQGAAQSGAHSPQ